MSIEIFTLFFLCGLAIGHASPNRVRNDNSSVTDLQDIFKSAQFAKAINKAKNMNEYFEIISKITNQKVDLDFDDEGVERSLGRLAMPAECIPELQPVSLEYLVQDTPKTIFPTCVRLKRCGGCCQHDAYHCVDINSTPKLITVAYHYLTSDGVLKYEKEAVTVKEHTECECQCIVKEKDCKWNQEYKPDTCECACLNHDEHLKCSSDSKRQWDPYSCSCNCRKTVQCGSDMEFSNDTCRCEISKGPKIYTEAEKAATDYAHQQFKNEFYFWSNEFRRHDTQREQALSHYQQEWKEGRLQK